MKAQEIIEGLKIIHEAKPEKSGDYHVRAEHDNIYAGSLEWELSEENKNRLHELGWEEDPDADGWRAMV